MAESNSIELSPETRERLRRWGGDRREESIIRELLARAEQDGDRWPANDYY